MLEHWKEGEDQYYYYEGLGREGMKWITDSSFFSITPY